MDELKFRAVTENDEIMECDTLFMFESPETGKNYIVFTDNTFDDDGNIRVYASIYNPTELEVSDNEDLAKLSLEPINTPEEWQIIETILQEMQEQISEDADGDKSETVLKTEGEKEVINVKYPE